MAALSRPIIRQPASRLMANPSTSATSRSPVETRPEPSRPAMAAASRMRPRRRPDSTSAPIATAASAKLLDPEQEATQRLRAQYAEISQLAGGLAHEIRNPLSTLSLNLDLLLEDFQNPRRRVTAACCNGSSGSRPEVQRLHGILESFLRFARVQELKLEPTDLNTVIDELRDFYEPHASTKGIVIRTRFAHDLPLCLLDRELFKQAALNLVFNAEHAMPSGGELILTTRRQGPWVRLEVIDTGVGMTEEVRARIFDAFFSTRAAGSGLGLPTAARSSRPTAVRSTCRASWARARSSACGCRYMKGEGRGRGGNGSPGEDMLPRPAPQPS